MKITLKGKVPSKKNSKIIVCRGTRPVLLPSRDYQQWQEEKLWELKAQRIVPPTAPIRVTIELYAPDLRKGDLTNKAESVMDLLVDAEILWDDNWFVCSEVILKFGGVDKENPRVEVSIESARHGL